MSERAVTWSVRAAGGHAQTRKGDVTVQQFREQPTDSAMFIAIEGAPGAGKTTLTATLLRACRQEAA